MSVIDVLKAAVLFIVLGLVMVGWGPSIGAWFWFLFHNWPLFGGNGWLVAQLLAWAVINVVWFCVAFFSVLFGLMDEFTPKAAVFGVLFVALAGILAAPCLLIYLYGW